MGAPRREQLAGARASPSRCDALAAEGLSAQTYDELLGTAEGSFIVLDHSGKTLYASPNTNVVLGVPPEALVGYALAAALRAAGFGMLAAAMALASDANRALARPRRRRALEGVVHPESRNHLDAMIRAVRAAPPCTGPATATVRAGAGDKEPRWSHIEFKLSSDVRAQPARARLRGAVPRFARMC